MDVQKSATLVAERIAATPIRGRRRLVALAGAPGSGKSTLAHVVAARVPNATVMPMDGFHLDDRLLRPAGLLPRKGAPETFDFGGFRACLARVAEEDEVILPVFDRTREIAIAGAERIGPETETVIVEGNYLCLALDPWSALSDLWDLTVYLSVPMEELERRLIERWVSYEYDHAGAREKAMGNDIPNAHRVAEHLGPVDLTIDWEGHP